MSFLSRLLGYATKGDLAGASLQGERWVIPSTEDGGVFLRSLPILFAADSLAYFEGIEEESFKDWLASHAIAPPLKIAMGTIWPKPDFYHVPLRPALMEEAAGLVDRKGIVLPSFHFHVHDGERVLLEWHDAFSDDPMYVSASIHGGAVEAFARAIGAGKVALEADYACLNCEHRFTIEVTESELQSSLDPNRTDVCPKCDQRVGTGTVRCRSCGRAFVLAFPHWHMHCNVASGDCPACGVQYVSTCIC
jgi:hypothetical protein